VPARNEVLGGANSIVEIDESLIARRKYNRGRAISNRWVFGAIERRADGEYRSFVEFVENRREETLLEIIRRRIAPGTTIVSDGWAAYRNLARHNYHHQVINHSANFVDPVNRSIHTQNIENNWKNIKRWLRNKGTNLGSNLHEYLLEYMYKKRHANDVFAAVVSHLVQM
jgi:transposase-like protein